MTPREAPNSALHEELELLATRAGMPPLQVIRSATLIGAMTIGKAGEMGTVEAGKLANLVVLERNPLDDLGNLRSVVFTVKRGRRFYRADYRPLSPEAIPDDESHHRRRRTPSAPGDCGGRGSRRALAGAR